MASTFSSIVNRALARVQSHAGQTATYTRGLQSLAVVVVWGRSEVEELSDNIVGLLTQISDAIVTDYAALLDTFGLPKPGDRISTGDGRVWRVLPAGSDQACWRWMGTERNALRIHCKLIGEE